MRDIDFDMHTQINKRLLAKDYEVTDEKLKHNQETFKEDVKHILERDIVHLSLQAEIAETEDGKPIGYGKKSIYTFIVEEKGD